jgi:hypothetical protein
MRPGVRCSPTNFPCFGGREFHRQQLIFVPESRGASLILSFKLAKFPVIVIVLGHAIQLTAKVAKPISDYLPMETVVGVHWLAYKGRRS